MPDISMCKGGLCPLKDNCYRHTTKPSEYWQAWFTTVPYEEDKKSCDNYWPTKEEYERK